MHSTMPLKKSKEFVVIVLQLVIVRGNPRVQNMNPYPTLNKPLPLIKGKGFKGSGSGVIT